MGGHPGGSCQCEGRFKLAIVAYVADLDGAGLLTSESIERLVREAIRKVAELAGKGPRVYSDNAGVAGFLQRTIEGLLYKDSPPSRCLS